MLVKDARPVYDKLLKELHSASTLDELAQWLFKNGDAAKKMPGDWHKHLQGEYAAQKIALMT
jgi:hypothetical protein